MAAKTKGVDADISEFYYSVDLTVDPPLPDSKIKAGNTDYLTLQQIKDEDVQLVNGEIVVVSNNVTGIKGNHDPTDYAYGYAEFKKAVEALAKIAKDAGSDLKGQVLVKDANRNIFYRLRVDNNKVVAEAAALGWPDGTQTPMPKDGCK